MLPLYGTTAKNIVLAITDWENIWCWCKPFCCMCTPRNLYQPPSLISSPGLVMGVWSLLLRHKSTTSLTVCKCLPNKCNAVETLFPSRPLYIWTKLDRCRDLAYFQLWTLGWHAFWYSCYTQHNDIIHYMKFVSDCSYTYSMLTLCSVYPISSSSIFGLLAAVTCVYLRPSNEHQACPGTPWLPTSAYFRGCFRLQAPALWHFSAGVCN